MSQLNAPRFVELYDLAVQRNVQSGSSDRDLNDIRVCSLVGYYFAGTAPVLRGRFHVIVPHTAGGFGVDSVSNVWREKLSTAAEAGSGVRTTG
jgi:hypothetical protein